MSRREKAGIRMQAAGEKAIACRTWRRRSLAKPGKRERPQGDGLERYPSCSMPRRYPEGGSPQSPDRSSRESDPVADRGK